MKILVLNYEYPPIGGGGGIICRHISEGLARLGNEVTVVTTGFKSKEQKSKNKNQNTIKPRRGDILLESRRGDIFLEPRRGDISLEPRWDEIVSPYVGSWEHHGHFRIIRLNARRRNAFQSNPLEMLSWIRTTKKFLKSWDETPTFDICFAHFVMPGGEVARFVKRKFKIPYVVMSHGHDIPWVHPRQMFFFHLATFSWIRHILKKSERNLLQTTMMKANADRFLGEKFFAKNLIIPNGVDPGFKPDYTKQGSKLRILFIGRLVIQKDPMTFLKALKAFSRHTQNFEVHILGDGDLRKKMERFCRDHGLDEKVVFKGKVHPDQMLGEYQSAHLMVAPSLNEGMSIAALEALACGVYLIATRASGFPDMITGGLNGDLVGFRDPQELASALQEYYLSRFLGDYRIPMPFLESFRKRFDWAPVVTVYHDLLGKITYVNKHSEPVTHN